MDITLRASGLLCGCPGGTRQPVASLGEDQGSAPWRTEGEKSTGLQRGKASDGKREGVLLKKGAPVHLPKLVAAGAWGTVRNQEEKAAQHRGQEQGFWTVYTLPGFKSHLCHILPV